MAIALVATAWMLNQRGLAPRADVMPAAAVETARRAGLDGNVFNSVRFGGYLLMAKIPAFVDGRADLYGDVFLQHYVAASNAIGESHRISSSNTASAGPCWSRRALL